LSPRAWASFEVYSLLPGWDEPQKAVNKIRADGQNQQITSKCSRKWDNQVPSQKSHPFAVLSLRSLVFPSSCLMLFCISPHWLT
jgi:hypothetical protein